ncbi:AP2 domain-containing protein [Sutcliffiella sp. FSL R7-0096]|uniref:AP2 domain-containing protein n=1 Tax=Sutcliffiella sp. FSL R7-0096 TaxID=2921670 RepID=UPI00315A5D1D
MRNDYEIRGEIIVIFLERREGPPLETQVSVKHLSRLLSLNFRFFASWDKKTKSFYAVYHTRNNRGKDSIRSLHRLITNCPNGLVVDHWDKDTLNNLDSNLKVVTQSRNLQNRNSIHPRNTTGYKGVSFCKRTGKYVAQIKVDKKHVWLGRHDTAEQAHATYMKYRKQEKIYVNTEVC